MKKWTLLLFSSLVWFAGGSMLLSKGLKFLVFSAENLADGGELNSQMERIILLIAASMGIGYLKYRFFMSRSVERILRRVQKSEEPLKWREIYTPVYFFLIGAMMSIGLLMNLLALSNELRGSIDTAIGSALLFGAVSFARLSYSQTKRGDDKLHYR